MKQSHKKKALRLSLLLKCTVNSVCRTQLVYITGLVIAKLSLKLKEQIVYYKTSIARILGVMQYLPADYPFVLKTEKSTISMPLS